MEKSAQRIEMDQKKVLTRILRRVSALWGIDNTRDLDPLVKLILEVLGYELSGLNQNLHEHQGRRLEDLADLLLPDQWRNASPVHGIISAIPLETSSSLSSEHQFYLKTKSVLYGGIESTLEHFFTPLGPSPLVKGRLSIQIHENQASIFDEGGKASTISYESNSKTSTQELWLGIDLHHTPGTLDELCLHIELPPQDWRLIPMLKHCQFETVQGQVLKVNVHSFLGTKQDNKNEKHLESGIEEPETRILKSIGHHYEGQFLSLTHPEQGIAMEMVPLPQSLASSKTLKEHDHFQTSRFWVKVHFPAAFGAKSIKGTRFRINTLPVVNRKLQKQTLRLTPGPNVIRLDIPEGYTFFGIQSIFDDEGRSYSKKKLGAPSFQAGTYSIHQLQLERIDKESAQDHLKKLIRIVHEDSALFKAYGYEIMLRQMSDLKNSLEEITKQVGVSDSTERPEKHYVLLYPFDSLGQIDFHYWVVPQSWDISSIGTGSELQQYKGIDVEAGSVQFQHPLHPGKDRLDGGDKIRRLLASIVSKERIVSKSDIRAYIHQSLGPWVKKVSVKSGVSVSSDPQRGFVRTTDIHIEPAPSCPLREQNWHSLLHGLSEELNQASIHTASYRFQLTTQAVFSE